MMASISTIAMTLTFGKDTDDGEDFDDSDDADHGEDGEYVD
jgi:hypothetical protein